MNHPLFLCGISDNWFLCSISLIGSSAVISNFFQQYFKLFQHYFLCSFSRNLVCMLRCKSVKCGAVNETSFQSICCQVTEHWWFTESLSLCPYCLYHQLSYTCPSQMLLQFHFQCSRACNSKVNNPIQPIIKFHLDFIPVLTCEVEAKKFKSLLCGQHFPYGKPMSIFLVTL